MGWKIEFDTTQNRSATYEIVDYIFKVLKDSHSETPVWVGITGQERGWQPEKKLSKEDLIRAASNWLLSCLESERCDPFNRPETDKVLTMPQGALEHWRTDPSFQYWIP